MFSQHRRIVEVGIDLGKSVVPPPAQSRIGNVVGQVYLGLYLAVSLKPPRRKTAQPLWAMTLPQRSVFPNFLEKTLVS